MKLTSTPSQVWCERKTDMQVVDELFTGHQDGRIDFTADYDSPSCCPDRISGKCGIDHDFGPDFRNPRISIDVIPPPRRHHKKRARKAVPGSGSQQRSTHSTMTSMTMTPITTFTTTSKLTLGIVRYSKADPCAMVN